MKKIDKNLKNLIFVAIIIIISYTLYLLSYKNSYLLNNLTTEKNIKKENKPKEDFLDYSMLNPVTNNGYYIKSVYNTSYPRNYSYPTIATDNLNPLNIQKNAQYLTNSWYPNLNLPSQVIGCGGRRQGCLGGTQVGVPTTYPPINISNNSISPITVRSVPIHGYNDNLHQVGIIQKVFGNENQVYPLFGRIDPRNKYKWQYYTRLGPDSVIVPIIAKTNNDELGTNDDVRVAGNSGKYRVTIYSNDYPRYIPYVY